MTLTRAAARSPSSVSPGVGRRHTFVFADLAGFTALTEAHGDEIAADLVGDFAARVGSWLPAFGGGQIKPIGDALMLRLESPIGAVELGLAVVERTRELPEFPEVRVGMNTGAAVERGGDWYGAAVNLAARVAAAAGGGEVLLTEATLLAAGQSAVVEIEPLGERRFRNVLDPVAVFRARRHAQPSTELSVDPVCRMALRPSAAWQRRTYAGLEYLFCSPECAAKFAADPSSYAPSESPPRSYGA
jgi:class 3 adenylate cyclase